MLNACICSIMLPFGSVVQCAPARAPFSVDSVDVDLNYEDSSLLLRHHQFECPRCALCHRHHTIIAVFLLDLSSMVKHLTCFCCFPFCLHVTKM